MSPALMPRTASALVLAAAAVGATVAPALALVQPYQVVRLITYRTSCDLAHLEDLSPRTGPMRFHATCGDLTSYPDGLDVVCDDRDDDRSCKVATAERTFRNLELLAPKH